MSDIGLVGAGVVGIAAAKKILEAGHTLWVFGPNQLVQDKFQALSTG